MPAYVLKNYGQSPVKSTPRFIIKILARKSLTVVLILNRKSSMYSLIKENYTIELGYSRRKNNNPYLVSHFDRFRMTKKVLFYSFFC